MLRNIPNNIMAIVDQCFAANICFDLAVVIDDCAYRIQSHTDTNAIIIDSNGDVIGNLQKD